jgi:ubiquinone/menaquinone biosynthesis C-methylase UbiE
MTAYGYLMESPQEGERLHQKTDLAFAESNLRLAGLRPGMQSIDVGCGIGMLTVLMHRISGHAKTVGVDGSASRIEAARRRVPPRLSGVEFVTADIRVLPQDDDIFDFSWSRFVFEYLRDPAMVLTEMKRVTRPGGVVAVADLDSQLLNFHPQSAPTAERMHQALHLLADHGFDPCVGRKLYALFVKAGLRDIKATVVPYQTFCGGLPAEARENWRQKLAAAGAMLLALDPSGRWDELGELVLGEMSSDDSFYYSTLIVVTGVKC